MTTIRLQAASFCIAALVMNVAADAAPAAKEPPLIDKTLVVWASPANLTQRGGSALTIDDQRGGFDGVVFGEIAPAKWMAGSDYYKRTTRDQAKAAGETAAPGTFVQLALVYHGRQITLYRDGKLYGQHTMTGEPMRFDEAAMIVIGKRHEQQTDKSCFAGEIDDARVYAAALNAEQIAALKPNEESTIKPWAWWTFDDKDAKERTGRFIKTDLLHGAKVDGGKLVLDGKSATLFGRTGKEPVFEYETPAMPEKVPATWLTYHLAHPGPGNAMPGDPNCAFYWKGRYHLHYIYTHRDGFSFAHVSSEDLLHWTWHPTTLTPPKTKHGMFSGTGFFTKEGKPAIIYHGQGSGRNQVAIAEDDKLEKWSAPIAVVPKIRPDQDGSKIANWDPDAWIDGDTYYALSGGSPGSGKPPTLMKSTDLKTWDYVGLFLSHDMPDVQKDEDISCPNFFTIGNKHMLLCISHNKGARYYLGQWKNEKFTPDFHARMNWREWECFAPESVLTPDGRRIMWTWCLLKGFPIQSGIQSLPRELSLPDDGVLRIKPLRELENLRTDERVESPRTIKAGEVYTLKDIAGDTIEISAVIEPGEAKQFGMNVFADKNGAGLPITMDAAGKTLTVAGTKAPFELKQGEVLSLRAFLDKNMIEVFANDRQAVVAIHKYDAAKLAVSLFSKSGDIAVKEIKGWTMKSIYK